MSFADLAALSDQFSALIAQAAPRLVAVHGADGGRISGIVWRTGLVVTAHEALAGEDDLRLTLADGSNVVAELAGRDPSTDVALLKAATPEFGDWQRAATPVVGSVQWWSGAGSTRPRQLRPRRRGGTGLAQHAGRRDRCAHHARPPADKPGRGRRGDRPMAG
jgi:hypothetical protein